MVIKNRGDVAIYMESRLDDIVKLSCEKRLLVVDMFLSLYHDISEAERYKAEYRYARSRERKGDNKSAFDLSISLANEDLKAIEFEFSKVSSE